MPASSAPSCPVTEYQTQACPQCRRQVIVAWDHTSQAVVALEPTAPCYVHIADEQQRWIVRRSVGAKVLHVCGVLDTGK
jgi:hypothetical protein